MPQSPPPDFSPPSRWITFEISAIGVICTIFLLFIYYRIMKRHCFLLVEAPMLADRSERRRFNEENPDEPYLQFHGRGLDSSVIQCLPTSQYNKKKEGGTGHGETECAVCLGDFEVGVMLRFLPNCRHSFHIACIDTWFKCHSNCPLCRSNVLYDLGDHQTHSVSILTLLETHRREDIVRETAPAAGAGGGGGGSHESSQMPTVGPLFQLVPFPSIGLC